MATTKSSYAAVTAEKFQGQETNEPEDSSNGRATMRPQRLGVNTPTYEYSVHTSSDEDDVHHGADGHPRRWSEEEDARLRNAVEKHHEANWKDIATEVGSRNHVQCLQRWKKVLAPGLVKGQWSREEDGLLISLMNEGHKNWGSLSSRIPGRTSKQCRERWCHHLDPSIIKGEWTEQEDQMIVVMHEEIGNKWATIAQHLNGRTENATKIRWKILERNKKQGEEGCILDQLQFPRANSGRQGTDERLRCLAAQAAAAAMSKANESVNPIGIPENPAAVKRVLAEKNLGKLDLSVKPPALPAKRRSAQFNPPTESSSDTTGLGSRGNGSGAKEREDPQESSRSRIQKKKMKLGSSTYEDKGALPPPGSGGGSSTAETKKESSGGGSGTHCGRRGWLQEEDDRLRQAVERLGERNWRYVAQIVATRTHVQCQQRWKKALRPGLVKGAWSMEEDENLVKLIGQGFSNWSELASHTPGRTAKQCRERWCHHLDPSVNHGNWTMEEDRQLKALQARLGTKWAAIAREMPGRTEHAVKGRVKTLARCERQTAGSGGGDIGAAGSKAASRTHQSIQVDVKMKGDSQGVVDRLSGSAGPPELSSRSLSPPGSSSLSPASPASDWSSRSLPPVEEEDNANLEVTAGRGASGAELAPLIPQVPRQPSVENLVWDPDASARMSRDFEAKQQQQPQQQQQQQQQQQFWHVREQRHRQHMLMRDQQMRAKANMQRDPGNQQHMQLCLGDFVPQQAMQRQSSMQALAMPQQTQMRFTLPNPAITATLQGTRQSAGRDDQDSIARLLSLSSGDSESVNLADVTSGCCGGALAAAASNDPNVSSAGGDGRVGRDSHRWSMSRSDNQSSGLQAMKSGQSEGQRQSRVEELARQSSLAARPPPFRYTSNAGNFPSTSAATPPSIASMGAAADLLLSPLPASQQKVSRVRGLSSGLLDSAAPAEACSASEAEASLLCNKPSDVDYSDLASFLTESFDTSQDVVRAGSECVSLGVDPYSDYLQFGCGGTLGLVQYPITQDPQASLSREVTQPLCPPAQGTRIPTHGRGRGGALQGAGKGGATDSFVESVFGMPNMVCDPYYDVPAKPLIH